MPNTSNLHKHKKSPAGLESGKAAWFVNVGSPLHVHTLPDKQILLKKDPSLITVSTADCQIISSNYPSPHSNR